MATISERLDWLQKETNAWANGGWLTKKEAWEKHKEIRKAERRCAECGSKLDKNCRYFECYLCRRKVLNLT